MIGEKIQELRLRLGYNSQIEFAKICGLSAAAICQYESDIRKPSTDALVKISQACGVSIEYLLGSEELSDKLQNPEDLEIKHAFFKQFNKLNEKNQRVVLNLMKSLGNNDK